MSLINDALKRARQAEQQAPLPVSPPPLKPVERSQYARHGVGLVVPVALGVVALLILFWVWQYAQERGAEQAPQSSAGVPPALDAAPQIAGRRAVRPLYSGVPGQEVVAPLAVAVTNVPAQPVSTPTNTVEAATSVPTNELVAATNSVPVADAPPKPAPLKLQALIYSANRPTVVISGKTLLVGDRIREFRVAAIDQESVTLIGAGQTNVLTAER